MSGDTGGGPGDALERLVADRRYRAFVRAVLIATGLLVVAFAAVRYGGVGAGSGLEDTLWGGLTVAVALLVLTGLLQVVAMGRSFERGSAEVATAAEELETAAQEVAETAAELEASAETVETAADQVEGAAGEVGEAADEKTEAVREQTSEVKAVTREVKDKTEQAEAAASDVKTLAEKRKERLPEDAAGPLREYPAGAETETGDDDTADEGEGGQSRRREAEERNEQDRDAEQTE